MGQKSNSNAFCLRYTPCCESSNDQRFLSLLTPVQAILLHSGMDDYYNVVTICTLYAGIYPVLFIIAMLVFYFRNAHASPTLQLSLMGAFMYLWTRKAVQAQEVLYHSHDGKR